MPQIELQNKVDHGINWDWENEHVSQSYDGGDGKTQDVSVYDIIESGTVLICAGPASMSAAVSRPSGLNGVRIVPIGLVEQATVAMSKPLSRIFEIGSKISYIIPGRTVGQIALARVMFDGPSLLKVLYQGEIHEDFQVGDKKFVTFSDGSTLRSAAPIGSGNIATNLASSFFDQPVGLGFFFRDRQNDTVSQLYFEGCRVSTHNLGIAANMNVLTESVSMEFVQCVPLITTGTKTDTIRVPGVLHDLPIIGEFNS